MRQLNLYIRHPINNGCTAALLLVFSSLLLAEPLLSLNRVETIALNDDPILQASELRALSASQRAIAEGQLADPTFNLGLFNVPTDNFDINKNPTTQLRLGVSQQLAKGDSLRLKTLQGEYVAVAQRERGAFLRRSLLKDVRLQFLEVLYQQKALNILRENRRYFVDLLTNSNHLYAVGRANQQAVLQAKLELSRLDDQINQGLNQFEIDRAVLAKWVPLANNANLLDSLPELPNFSSLENLEQNLQKHPAIAIEDAYIAIAKQGVHLAEEQYKPAYSLGVEYRKRFGNEPSGSERADMLAAMLSVEMPIFTEKRQDKHLAARQYDYQAVKLKRLDSLRDIRQKLRREYGNWLRLQQRSARYDQQLLKQAAAHTSAALSAYQSGVVDFSTLMYARISELETRLHACRVAIDLLKAQSNVLFYSVEKTQTEQGSKYVQQ